jgi:hypothetical protein
VSDVRPVVTEYPARLGELAEILRRRRIGVGVDARGQLVLARPDSIQVDFNGTTKRRKAVLDLVDQIDADNGDAVERYDAEATGVLTVQVAAEVTDIGGEPRWTLNALNS